MDKIISFEDIRNNDLINSLIVESDNCLSTINFTKHDKAHVMFVVQIDASPDLDEIFNITIDFLNDTKARTVAFAQAGEMMGGTNGQVWKKRLKRKAMNTFFFKVGTPEEDIKFIGRFNDDVNTYVSLGSRGELFLQYGTYVKSFYSVMCNPSSVKVAMMGETHRRIHHAVD